MTNDIVTNCGNFLYTTVSAHMSAVRDMFAHYGNNITHNVLVHEYIFEGFCGYGAKMDDKFVVMYATQLRKWCGDQFGMTSCIG